MKFAPLLYFGLISGPTVMLILYFVKALVLSFNVIVILETPSVWAKLFSVFKIIELLDTNLIQLGVSASRLILISLK